MKLPLSWLKEYVDIGEITPNELADKLLNVGFEVEEIIYLGKNIENVLTAKITKIEKHPNADKLQICHVDYGFEQSIVVTAATNVFEGAIVPVARDNSVLPTGKHITAGELRGVTSYGMFCSGAELCVDDSVIEGAEVNGILILPQDTPIGEDVKKVLRLDEYVLDVSVTANRPDCQSIIGMSREVAAVLGKEMKYPSIAYTPRKTDIKCFDVSIENENCSAYTGTVIDKVTVAPSPEWMRDRLRYVGLRPINNLVDITNYVLLEVGQPLHAFDLNCVKDKIIVRSAVDGEEITALNDVKYKLSSDMMVIADAEKSLAIAGIMGGEYSGISDKTTAVFLEAAKFARGNVRTTSRKLGLRSDSSARYEKGVDWFNLSFGRARALNLFETLGAGVITDRHVEAGNAVPKERTLVISVDRINKLLGIEVAAEKMAAILNGLGITTTVQGDQMTCIIPLYRDDIDNYADITEEIIRYYGYDNLKSTFIEQAHPTIGGKTKQQKAIDSIKDYMVSCGVTEAATFSFISEKQYDKLGIEQTDSRRNFIRIINPLSEEYSVMRTQLVGSMLESVARNYSFKNDDYRLFEIARTYKPKSLPLNELPDEIYTLCVCFTGESEDFYALKATVCGLLKLLGAENVSFERSETSYLHPGISADVFVSDKKIGYLGKIHPETAKAFDIPEHVFVAEIVIHDLIGIEKKTVRFRPLPKFPIVERDVAVIVNDEVPVGKIIDCIYQSAGEICDDVKLFDVYRGNQIITGKKSVAFSLKLRNDDHTLVDGEIQEVMKKVVEGLESKLHATLR